jgi:hypothetical protein
LRAALKNQTISQQNVWHRDLDSVPVDIATIGESPTTVPTHPRNTQGLPPIDPPCTSSAVLDIEDRTLSFADLDGITPHMSYDNHLGFDLLEPQINQINNHLAKEDQEDVTFQGTYDDQVDFPDEDALPGDEDLDHGDEINVNAIPPSSEPTEDDVDPFLVDRHPTRLITDVLAIPHHLLVIYVLVSWLHLQFHLPHIACNAVLAILACLIKFFDPHLPLPFISLQSVTRMLAVDPPIELLPVCPNC